MNKNILKKEKKKGFNSKKSKLKDLKKFKTNENLDKELSGIYYNKESSDYLTKNEESNPEKKNI